MEVGVVVDGRNPYAAAYKVRGCAPVAQSDVGRSSRLETLSLVG